MGRPKRTVPVNSIIGERIRITRKNNKLSQEQLAENICVSVTSVRNWEKSRFEPDLSNLQLIADECNVTVSWLKGEDMQTLVEMSQQILSNYNRNPDKFKNIAPELSAKVQTWAEEWYPIVDSFLEYFGYSAKDIGNSTAFYHFSDFMEAEVKHSIEIYMKNFSEKEKTK